MMYQVSLFNDGVEYIIHNSSTDSSVSKLSSGTISIGINSISSFEFTMLPNNIGFNRMTPLKTRIVVTNIKTGEEVFNGRVLKLSPKMSTSGAISKTVVCEDRLGYLQDSIQPYLEETTWKTDEESTGLQKFLEYLLEQHNAQVDDYKKIFIGEVTATTLNSDNSCDKGCNYETTWEIISSKLIDVFDGEISLREENGILYLDYLEEVGETSNTIIELGKNMKSIDEEIDYEEVFTRLIPLGAKLTYTDEAGNEVESGKRLTIADVNNGVIWLDTTKIDELGIIVKTVEFDNITVASNLYTKAKEYIDTAEVVTEKHNLSVVDLSIKDDSYDELKVGNYHTVKNTLLNLDKKLRIIKKSLDICKPTSSSITVGDTQQTLSDITINKAKDVADILQQVNYITANYTKNTALTNSYSQLSSLINQTYEQILLLVSETYVTNDDYLEKIAQLEVLIDQVTVIVSEVTSLTEQYSSLEVSLNGISQTVSSLSDQSANIASLTVTLEEIQQQITALSDLTTSDMGIGTITLKDVNESALIYLQIYPTGTDISYLYPSNSLYPSADLYPLSRDVVIKSDEEEIRYTLPCNLLYYSSDVYDEFIYSYETSTCYKIKRVDIDENGDKYVLDEEEIIYYDFELINLSGGNYSIYLLSFSDGMIQARAMVSNLYTDQYVTQAQYTSGLSILKDEINASVEEQITLVNGNVETLSSELDIQATEISLKLNATDFTSAAVIGLINNRDGTSTALISADNINLTASNIFNIIAGNTLNLTSNNMTISATNFSVTSSGVLTCTGADITGKITATSGSFTGSIYASSGTIGGMTLSSNSIYYGTSSMSSTTAGIYLGTSGFRQYSSSSAYVNIANGILTCAGATVTGTISGSTISGSTISGGSISINNGTNYFSVTSSGTFSIYNGTGFLNLGVVSSHPWVSGINLNQLNGINFYTGSSRSSLGSKNGYIGFASNTSGAAMYITNSNGTVNINHSSSGQDGGSVGICNITISGTTITGGGGGYMYANSNCMLCPTSTSYYAYVRTTDSSNRIAVSSSGPSSLNVKKNLVNIEDEYEDLYKDLQKINMYNFDYKYKGIKDFDSDFGFIIDELEDTEYISKYIRNFECKGRIENDTLIQKENDDVSDEDLPFSYKEWERDAYIKLLFILIKSIQNKLDKLESEVGNG